MQKAFLLIYCSLLINTCFAQSNLSIENAQERLAARIVREVERGNFDSAFHYLDPAWLKSRQSKLSGQLENFHKEFKLLAPGTRRFITRVFPTGLNLFRFRYFDSTGTALQIDLSFKTGDINSKLMELETVDRATLKKQRDQSNNPRVVIEDDKKKQYPYTTIFLLRNCQGEKRTFTFGSPTGFFKWWVNGKTNLETNRIATFSKDYPLDSNFLRNSIDKVKKSLPSKFWTFPMEEPWHENLPDENAIWFTQIFAQVEKSGNIKVFSAIKVTFEGDDARIDRNRMNPKIKNVEFILNKDEIKALEKKLKASPKTL